MKLHVLICCYNDSLLDVPDILLPERPDVSYVISHQHSAGYSLPDDTDERKSRVNEMLARPDVVLTSIEGKGVSRNRNNCLKQRPMMMSVLLQTMMSGILKTLLTGS